MEYRVIYSLGIAKTLGLEGTSVGPSPTPNPGRNGLGPIEHVTQGHVQLRTGYFQTSRIH